MIGDSSVRLSTDIVFLKKETPSVLKYLHSTGIFPSYSYPCIKTRGAQPCYLCSELEPVDAFIVHLTAFYFVFLYCF